MAEVLDAILKRYTYIVPEVAQIRASVRLAPAPFTSEGRAKWPFWAEAPTAGGQLLADPVAHALHRWSPAQRVLPEPDKGLTQQLVRRCWSLLCSAGQQAGGEAPQDAAGDGQGGGRVPHSQALCERDGVLPCRSCAR